MQVKLSHLIFLALLLTTSKVEIPTCVYSAGMEQRVCVGDKLQLSVQVGQQAA